MATPADGAEDLTVTASPAFATEAATVRVVVRIDPHPSDRLLLVEADSIDYYRSSTIALAGDEAPRIHQIELRSLPAGRYVVRVTRTRALEGTSAVETKFRVVGPAP
jgi:hypothetical protein